MGAVCATWLAGPLLGECLAQAPAAPAPAAPASAAAAQPVPLAVAAQTPEPGKLILERRPRISATLGDAAAVDPKTVTVEVDGVDVTLLVTVEQGRITYTPPADLAHGERTVRISAAGPGGVAFAPAEWKFKIRRFAAFEEASLSGELSSTFERALRKPKKEPADASGVSKKTETPVNNLQNNLSVRGLLKEGDFTARLDSNLRYNDEFRPRARPKSANDKLDIANYLIGVERNPLLFELGDVSIQEGFFGAPSLSRRGMHLKLDQLQSTGLAAQAFGTRYETTQGHDPFFGPEDGDSVLYGGAVLVAPFQDRELLKLHGLGVRGHRFSSAPGSNVGAIVSGERGELWSFGTSSALFGGQLKFSTEIAFSEFDQDTLDEAREEADKAWRARLEGTQGLGSVLDAPVMTLAAFEYSYVGFSFRSPANPGIQPDRRGFTFKDDTTWKIVIFSWGYSAFEDNTDLLVQLPRVRSRTWEAALGLAPPELPSPVFTYKRQTQRSFYEPESFGEKGVDNTQTTYDLRVTWGLGENLSANWGATLIVLDDKRLITSTTTGGDTYTWQAQMGLTLKPLTTLSVSPNYNYTRLDEKTKTVVLASGETVHDRVRTETHTGTLTLAQELIAKILILDVQASGAASASSDDSVDNQTYSGVARLTWNVGSLFWAYGKQALSLRTNFNRVVDHVARRDTNEVGIFLILDLLSPYSL